MTQIDERILSNFWKNSNHFSLFKSNKLRLAENIKKSWFEFKKSKQNEFNLDFFLSNGNSKFKIYNHHPSTHIQIHRARMLLSWFNSFCSCCCCFHSFSIEFNLPITMTTTTTTITNWMDFFLVFFSFKNWNNS